MAIDIGAGAINRSTSTSESYTYIDKINPANESGVITAVEIWAYTNLVGCIVGTFYVVSGYTLKCRDSVAIGSVTSGSKQTFSGLSLTVEVGDYIGFYATSGRVERDSSGYDGNWRLSGEYIDPGDEATYGFLSGDAISLYGSGGIGGEPAGGGGAGARLELEVGTDVLLLETGDALLLETGDVIITVPLATIDSVGIVPTFRIDRIFSVPLATIDSAALVPVMSMGVGVVVPLATITSTGFVPTFIIDRIFAIPLATITSTGVVPTIRVDRIFSVPITTITATGLVPVMSLGVGVITPLATISSEGIAPELYLELFRALADFTNRRTTADFTNLRTMVAVTNRKVMNVFTNLREWINHTGIRS